MVSPGKIKLNHEKRFKGAFQECDVFFSGGEEGSPWASGTGAGGTRKQKWVCGYGTLRPSSASNVFGLSDLTCEMERISPVLTNSLWF